MANILQDISIWSAKLPYWEQLALDKVINRPALIEADYLECLQFLLEDAGLSPASVERPALMLPQLARSEPTTPGHRPLLSKLTNLHNVNALKSDQTLTFCPQLTLIYGANGSGKSGYARLLASAAFTRGDKDILRDISQPMNLAEEMCADIEVVFEGATRTLHYIVGNPLDELRNFYVFDSTSVQAHLTKSHEFSFSPLGLSYLSRLAAATEEIRVRLAMLVDQRRRPNLFAGLFLGVTRVSVAMASLGAGTDMNELRQLAAFTEDDHAKLLEIEQAIANLKVNPLQDQIKTLEQEILDLDLLAGWLTELSLALGEQRADEIGTDIKDWARENALAQELGTSHFRDESLSQVGTPVWRDFVVAANKLAKSESSPETLYPQADDHCLLCHQPLSPDALQLIRHLWELLESRAQSEAKRLGQVLGQHDQDLRSLEFENWNDQRVAYRELAQLDSEVFREIATYVETCRNRHSVLMGAIQGRTAVDMVALPPDPTSALLVVANVLRLRLESLRQQDQHEELAKLQKQKDDLEHRMLLSKKLPEIATYVGDCDWASRASDSKVARNTAHITRKHNELFKAVVTDRYIELFQANLQKLNCPLKVELKTKGQRGVTLKQLTLHADASMSRFAEPDKVLSEGEQRAVALADFLTEAELDSNSAGLIFDDPVTSLDFAWKEVIAKHVAEAAKTRQIIVFTHDLHFLYCLMDSSSQQTISTDSHWIQHRDGKPGWVYLHNSPSMEKEFRKLTRPNSTLGRARLARAEEQENLLHQGFGELRTCYEAFVVFDLFNSVVLRFDEVIGFGKLKDVLADRDIITEVVHRYEKISRYIDAHLHSDQFAGVKPTPDDLAEEIGHLEGLKKQLRDKKKAIGIAN